MGIANPVCVSEMAAIGVWVSMAASPSLSHSSQEKAWRQDRIEYDQMVSDECSSGVVRVVQEAQSIPGVCSLCAGDRLVAGAVEGPLH